MPAPRKKSAASLELSSSTATRSPGRSPSPISPFAMRQPRVQASAKVSRSLPCTIASRFAKNVAARRITLVTSMVPSQALAARPKEQVTEDPVLVVAEEAPREQRHDAREADGGAAEPAPPVAHRRSTPSRPDGR